MRNHSPEEILIEAQRRLAEILVAQWEEGNVDDDASGEMPEQAPV